MTDTFTTHPAATHRPLSGQPTATQAHSGRRHGWLRRWGRSIAYDALLVPVGVQTMADAMLDEEDAAAARRWRRLARLLHPEEATAPTGVAEPRAARSRNGLGRVFGYGLVSSVLGLISWFLLLLVVTAVVRGPFYGFVEHGPFGPGTWGGPTKAGAWAVHAGLAVPMIVVFLLVLRGIAWLQASLVRRLDETTTARWVLPATIAVATGGLMFFWSWLQQL